MAAPPIVFPPPQWTNQDIILFHGTTGVFAESIVSGPIRVALGRPNRDFGIGFYTTTLERQALTWAVLISTSLPGTTPAVIEIKIGRRALARLKILSFVRGDFEADDYWSFVHHCRQGGATASYDVVHGPLSAFWDQRMIVANADQMSFHTAAAEVVLNASPRRRII